MIEQDHRRVAGTRVVRRATVSVRLDTRTLVVCCGMLLAIVLIAGITLSVGDYHVPVGAVLRTLVGGGSSTDRFIVTTLRLPRLLCALLVGAALGCSGAIFQSVSRNPLGSPDIIGFQTGAATGALLEILVGSGGTVAVAAGSIVGGLATSAAVYLLAYSRGVQGYRLILIGIGIAAMLSSVNSFLLTRASLSDAVHATVWLTGSLNGLGWEHVPPVAVAVAVGLPLAIWVGRDLRMLELGDDAARGTGVAAERTRLVAVLIGVGLSALATATAGPIVFIALAAPQLARRCTDASGPGMAAAALMGTGLLAASDLAAQRLFASAELPVGVMTGAVGGVYLAWLLVRQWRGGRG